MDSWKVWLVFAVIPNQIAGRILLVTEMDAAAPKEMLTSAFTYTSRDRLSQSVTIEISRDSEREGYKEVCQELSSGVSLAVDLTWTGWPGLQDLCFNSGVPYILLESPLRVFVRAIDGILRGIRNASDAIIILSDGKFLEELLYYIVRLTHIRVYVLPGLSPDAIHALKDMRPMPSFFVLLASARDMNVIVSTAVEHQLMKNERWYLVFTDFNFASFNRSLMNVIPTYVTMTPNLCCKLLQLLPTCQCPQDLDAFERMNNITVSQAGQLLTSILQDLRYSETSLAYICDSSATASNDTRNSFYQHLNQTLFKHPTLAMLSSPEFSIVPRITLDVNNTLQGNRIGSWSVEGGMTLNHSYLIVPVKRFFMVGVIQAIPWSYRLTGPTQDGAAGDAWGGYCLDFLDRLAYELNFDYQLVPTESYGTRRADSAWDGLVGDLAAGRTDLVVAPLTMTAEREEVVDFVAPYFEQTGISIVIRKPERQTSPFKFMTVLRLEVWLSIVGVLIVTGIMIWFLDKYSPYSARNNKNMHPYPCREFTLKESFWFAMTSFTPQGGGETPKALSGRTLVAAYWLFVVLMLATFTANLAAFLTVERMQNPVQSLEQLSRQSRINYTVVADSDTHHYFKNMKYAEDTLYRVWKEIVLNASSDQTQYRVWDYPIKEQYGHILKAIEKTGPVPDAATGFSMVNEHESGWFALIHDAAEIRYEVYRNCNLTEVGEIFAEQPYAVAVQQGSQLNEEISRKILDLQKERYFETLSAKYWNTSGKRHCFNSDDNDGITLESLGGVFIATLFGLALALITLAVEIFLHKKSCKMEDTSEKVIYHEYISKKEFGTEHLSVKKSELVYPKPRVITVFPRNQFY